MQVYLRNLRSINSQNLCMLLQLLLILILFILMKQEERKRRTQTAYRITQNSQQDRGQPESWSEEQEKFMRDKKNCKEIFKGDMMKMVSSFKEFLQEIQEMKSVEQLEQLKQLKVDIRQGFKAIRQYFNMDNERNKLMFEQPYLIAISAYHTKRSLILYFQYSLEKIGSILQKGFHSRNQRYESFRRQNETSYADIFSSINRMIDLAEKSYRQKRPKQIMGIQSQDVNQNKYDSQIREELNKSQIVIEDLQRQRDELARQKNVDSGRLSFNHQASEQLKKCREELAVQATLNLHWEGQCNKLKEDLAKAQAEIQRLEEGLKGKDVGSTYASETIKAAANKVQFAQSPVNNDFIFSNTETTESKLQNHEEKNRNWQEERDKHTEQIENLKEEICKLKQRIKDLQQEQGRKDVQICELKKVRDLIQLKQRQNISQIRQLKNNISTMQANIRQKDRDLKEMGQLLEENKHLLMLKCEQLERAKEQMNQAGLTNSCVKIRHSFLLDKSLFVGNMLDKRKQDKKYLVDQIQRLASAFIDSTTKLYQFKRDKSKNFHEYIDNHSNLVVIVETKSALFAGFYMGKLQEKQPMVEEGLIISLNNRKSYKLFNHKNYPKKDPKDKRLMRGMTYDKFYIIIGNAQIRLKTGENTVFSNFGISNAFFCSEGDRVHDLLGEDGKNEVDIINYEIFEVLFDTQNEYSSLRKDRYEK